MFSTAVVVFLTYRVGLIEWMNNTKPFKEVLQNAMTKNEHEHYVGK